VKLRARWRGLPPRAGDYLASPTRPRFAYRVLEVRNVDARVRWDAAKKAELRRLAIEVKRVPIAELPTTARVHDWNQACL
jgi:hypothetical protein